MSGIISTLALFNTAILGKCTLEPSVCTPCSSISSISFKNNLTGILSSVSFPAISSPTNETNSTSGCWVRMPVRDSLSCFSGGILNNIRSKSKSSIFYLQSKSYLLSFILSARALCPWIVEFKLPADLERPPAPPCTLRKRPSLPAAEQTARCRKRTPLSG